MRYNTQETKKKTAAKTAIFDLRGIGLAGVRSVARAR